MKKSLLKILTVLLILTMATSLFSGCTSKKEDEKTTTPAKTAEQEKTQADTKPNNPNEGDKYCPKEDKVYTITYLVSTYGQPKSDSEVVKKYNELFNVKLESVWIDPNKWDDLLNIKLASGEIPDIIMSKSTDRLAKYQSQGLLTEVPKDVIQKYSPNVYKLMETDAPKAWYTTTIKGKNYGIPYIVGSSAYRIPIVWRGDWLKQVGIEKVPDTIKEFEEAFTKFTKEDPDKNGKADTYGCGAKGFSPIFGAFGAGIDLGYDGQWEGLWTVKDGKLVYNMVIPESKEALKLLATWYKQGIIDPDFVSPKGENKGGYWAITSDFVNNRIGFSTHGANYHWQKEDTELGVPNKHNVSEFIKINPDKSADDILFGLPPAGPDGKTRGAYGNVPITGVSYTFSKNLAKEPDKIGKILQMFDWPAANHENWIFSNYGIKGTHYDFDKVGNYDCIKRVEPYNEPVKYGEAGLSAFFYEPDITNLKKISPSSFMYYEKHGFDKYKITSELLAPLPSQPKYGAELKKILSEGYFKIILGEKPVDYFDELVSSWNKAGGEHLTKEANEWFDSVK